jgi:hypothetical protein
MFRHSVVALCTLAVTAALSACGTSNQGAAQPPVAQNSAGPMTRPAARQVPRQQQQCGVDLSSPTIQAAIPQVPIEQGTDWQWDTNPKTFQGNFNPCATLSTAIITIQRGTGSSPDQALMFHFGRYLGTATAKPYGFTTLVPEATTDDTVVLSYMTPGSCDACADGTFTHVQFHWDGQRVVMIGNPPRN